jgi:hypothetical protein
MAGRFDVNRHIYAKCSVSRGIMKDGTTINVSTCSPSTAAAHRYLPSAARHNVQPGTSTLEAVQSNVVDVLQHGSTPGEVLSSRSLRQ